MKVLNLNIIVLTNLLIAVKSSIDHTDDTFRHLKTYEKRFNNVESKHNERRLSAWWNIFTLGKLRCFSNAIRQSII